jgi:hypothetical protein
LATRQVFAVMAKSAALVPETEGGLVKVSEAVPVFMSVTVTGVLAIPCATEPKGTLAGRLTTGAAAPEVPVPVKETLCGLLEALSAKVSEALSAAIVDGLKVSITVQVAPAATMLAVEQVELVMTKSAAFAPVTAGLLVKVSGPPPVFFSVTVMTGLVPPCGTEPKAALAGRLTTGGVGGLGEFRLLQLERVNRPAASAPMPQRSQGL